MRPRISSAIREVLVKSSGRRPSLVLHEAGHNFRAYPANPASESALRAITYHGPGDLRTDSAPDPALDAATDVLLKVELAAICGSDLHLYAKLSPLMVPGDVIGHEPMGVVEEVETVVRRAGLDIMRQVHRREATDVVVEYELRGPKRLHDQALIALLHQPGVRTVSTGE